MTSTSSHRQLVREHSEPEKPLVYEPHDLQGRKHVEKVAGEYRVREDQCLADKLQTEEFEFHFGKNKSERFLGKMDIKTAKQIYLTEVEQSGLLSKDELSKLNNTDAALARDIDNQLNQNIDLESQRKQASQMQDEEFAKYLEAKERQKHEEERKKRLKKRIAQDRAEAERLQRSLEEEAYREEQIARGMRDLKVESPQKGGWAIDCEIGATMGDDKTQKELQLLKDEEIARSLQLKEVEKEKKRVEEQRDRRMALKIHQQEDEEYKRKQQEKQMRRVQSERRPTEDDLISEEKRKHLQSVNGKGTPIPDDSGFRDRPRAKTASAKSLPVRSTKENGQHFLTEVNSGRSEESSYLQAVDSPRLREQSDSHRRTNQPLSEFEIKEQQLYDNAVRRRNSGNTRVSNDKDHRNGHRSNSDRRGSCKKNDQDQRLIDDQDVLRQQTIEQINHPGSQPHRHRSSVKSENSREEMTWDLHVQDSLPTNGNLRQNTEGYYNTPEENSKIEYKNVARSLDPTYQTIGPSSKINGQIGILETEATVADVRPVPVIKNVKRASKEEQKRKKKWFSKNSS